MSPAHLPVVSIVGRPNVGKSTLFNRILKSRRAVVDEQPGATRDRHTARAIWEGRSFLLVDTGGLLLDTAGVLETKVNEQVEAALHASDVVLLVVDGRVGPLPDDAAVVERVRRRGGRAILVVSKIDSESLEPLGLEFMSFGMPETHLVSGLEGRGLGEMLDELVAGFPLRETDETASIRLCVIGRPNVGKSSLVNALLREDRMIVSEVPGTTRDSIDTPFRWHGKDFTLIDTAGLRRRSRVESLVEYHSVLRAAASLERSDAAIVVLDASQPVSRQDYRISALPFERGRPAVFAFNKWDLLEKETNTARDLVRNSARRLPDFRHAPSIFISATKPLRVGRILPAVLEVHANARREVPADELNEFLDACAESRSHPYVRGRMMKFFGMRQTDVAPPLFIVYCNRPGAVEESWRRFLVNRLRARFGFSGTPIRLKFRTS